MNEWGVLLTLIGVWGWIACMIVFIFRSFPSRGVLICKQAIVWGGATLGFFVCWIVGMLAT